MKNREAYKFILERIHKGWQVNAYVYRKDAVLLESSADSYEGRPAPPPEKELVADIWQECSVKGRPVVYMEENMIYYTAFLDEEENLFLHGPAAAEGLSFAQLHAYRQKHRISLRDYHIPCIAPIRALNYLSMALFAVTGQMVTEEELLENESCGGIGEEDIVIYEFHRDSEEKRRLAYKEEQKWMAAIEAGTMEEQDKSLTPENMEKLERIGTLALHNSFKQCEYMVITSVCLASRAAIRGGMNTYEAYTLSDLYYQKVSQCSNVLELLNLSVQVANDFCSRVKKAREQHRVDYIEQCKDYIARHRSHKFTVSDMARELGMNRCYLSRKFSEQVGMTIQEYALETRLEASANMLKYSDVKIGEIADYLCFNSQSYFGERFRMKYGMTPLEYRKKNRIIDFITSD